MPLRPNVNSMKVSLSACKPLPLPSATLGANATKRNDISKRSSLCCRSQEGLVRFFCSRPFVSLGYSFSSLQGTITALSDLMQQKVPTDAPSTALDNQASSQLFEDSQALGFSWPNWLQYFENCDAAAEKKDELTLDLKDAIRQEQYCSAARLKGVISALDADDSVAATQQQLQAALSAESYAAAAQLRDGGLSGLQGWWAGQADDDPVGHIMHITPEYSRWTGRVFRPREIAAMKVSKPSSGIRGQAAALLTSGSLRKASAGSPILEVFVRPERQPSGKLQYLHQAVSLRLPTVDEAFTRSSHQKGARSSTLPSQAQPSGDLAAGNDLAPKVDVTGSVVHLSVLIHGNGTASIRPRHPPPALNQPPAGQSNFGSREAAEAEQTMRMLHWPGSDERGTAIPTSAGALLDKATSRYSCDAVYVEAAQQPAVEVDDVPHPATGAGEVIDITSQNAMSSIDGEDSAFAMVAESANVDGEKEDDANDSVDAIDGRSIYSSMRRCLGHEDEGMSLSSNMFSELSRIPALIEMVGRDRFVFHVPDDETVLRQAGNQSVFGHSAGQLQWGKVPPRSLPFASAAQPSGTSSYDGDVTASFEVIVPVTSRKQEVASGSSSAAGASSSFSRLSALEDTVPAEVLDVLADQVAQSVEAKLGRVASREDIAEALKEVVRRMASGEPETSVDISLSDGGREDQQRQLSDAVTSIHYQRILVDPSKTDPLSGLYLGSFGPHGPELLSLMRSVIDGEETLLAVKLTGDTNVPAGSVSFRARIGRKQRLDGRDVYPDELGIAARYKGEGRVAQKGFTQPRWVEGELLVFNSKGNSVTGGAELGFVWAVPGEKRFLILLNRVDLGEAGK